MKNLGMMVPGPTDGTSFYRAMGVFTDLFNELDIRNLSIGKTATWADIVQINGVFMQRPWGLEKPSAIDFIKAQRKLVWVDYDDDLFSVPFSNPTHQIYKDEKAQNAMASILAKADIVTVSTKTLQTKFQRILEAVKDGNPNDKSLILNPEKIIYCPNAYNLQLMGPIEKTGKQRKIVLWRGSSTHDKDMMEYTAAMANVMQKHLDFTYVFVGSPFWWSIEQFENIPGMKKNNIVLTGSLDPIEYFQFLRETLPALVVVPLHDCEFNRAKSNIAWIEATMAGAVCLAPDWEEWRVPGVINYKDQVDFAKKMDAYLSQKGYDGLELWTKSAEYIKEHLTLGKVNKIRRNILEAILN